VTDDLTWTATAAAAGAAADLSRHALGLDAAARALHAHALAGALAAGDRHVQAGLTEFSRRWGPVLGGAAAEADRLARRVGGVALDLDLADGDLGSQVPRRGPR
jgi:hypothetical protein